MVWIKKIGFYLFDKWLGLALSGGSIVAVYKGFVAGMPDFNIAYITLICWAVGLITFVVISSTKFGRRSKNIPTSFDIVFNDTQDIQFDKQTAKNICYYYCEGNYAVIRGLENKITFIIIFQKPLPMNYYFDVSSANNKGNFFITLQHKDNMFCRISLEGKDILQQGAIYNIKANF